MELNALSIAHRWLRTFVRKGDLCIDATAGRGRDTQLLCELVGETGHVLAFDVQRAAAEQTRQRLQANGLLDRADIFLDSHSHMERYAQPASVRAIVFNFGYLPGGDHHIFTRPESSIPALQAGLRLLMPGGGMSLSIYYGGDTGYVERDCLLQWLRDLPQDLYTVLIGSFANRKNDPPIPVLIWREAKR